MGLRYPPRAPCVDSRCRSRRNAIFAVGFPSANLLNEYSSQLILKSKYLARYPGESAIRHAGIEGFLEHDFEGLILHAETNADTVAEIGWITRHIRAEDAALRLLAFLHVIGECVLVADNGVEPPFGEIEDRFLKRCIGVNFRLFVNILDISLMGAARTRRQWLCQPCPPETYPGSYAVSGSETPMACGCRAC